MPKAYSYIRFSSIKQQKGDSVERQIRLSENYAAKHGLELDTELNLSDLGISAYDRSNLSKGALGQFLKLIEENRIQKGSYLLVESLDRLSRDKVMDALAIFLSILKAGITIVTLADEQSYSHEKANENFTSLIMSIVIMSRANEESAIKSMRVRSSWDAKRKNITNKRLTARCPYWLKPAGGDIGFELIPERVNVVKRIFQMSKDGIGNATIVKLLNAENVPRFSDKTDGWQTSYIQKILSSRAVYGELQLNLQRDGDMTPLNVIQDYYPAILSKQDWLLVSSARTSRRTRGGVSKGKHLSNLFSGLLRCGYCGSPMNMGGYVNKKANGEKRQGKYVACSNGRRGMGCKFIQWNYKDLEDFILRYCKTVDFSKALASHSNISSKLDNATKLNLELAEKIKEQEKIRDNITAAIEVGELGMDLSFLAKRISETTQKINELVQLNKLTEEEVARLANEVSIGASNQKIIVEVSDRLKALDGNELHQFRIRLSELIKKSVSQIKLYPWGIWKSDSENILRDSLKEAGYTAKRINEYFSEINAIPKIKFRHMEMQFSNGEIRVVSAETGGMADYNPATGEWINKSDYKMKLDELLKRVK